MSNGLTLLVLASRDDTSYLNSDVVSRLILALDCEDVPFCRGINTQNSFVSAISFAKGDLQPADWFNYQ